MIAPATAIDAVVKDYLGRVQAALATTPAPGGREVLDELTEHIREAREDGVVRTEADARNLVDRLGEPEDIALEAQRRFGRVSRPAAGLREVGALLLIGVGILLPVIGWMAGMALLWTSDSWNRRDKIIGTVLSPGGSMAIVLAAVAHPVSAISGDGSSPLFQTIFGVLLVAFVFFLPTAIAVFLLVQLLRARAHPVPA